MKENSRKELEELLHQGYRYALSLVQQSHAAEDILQSAFFSILKAAGPINKAYVFTTIRHTYFNQYKREKLVPMTSYEDSNGDELEASWDNTAWVGEIRDLEKALATLRTIEREVIFLAYIEEFTAEEVAKLTGLTRGTILSLMHRAKKKLQVYLESTIDEALQ